MIRRHAWAAALAVTFASRASAQGTDTTFNVSPGTRLRMNVVAGKVEVRAWERNAVQVHGVHDANTSINIGMTPGLVSLDLGRSRGIAECDCTITIPKTMAVTINGGDTEITVIGTSAEVVVKNYSGRITVTGGRDKVDVESTLGEVTVSGLRGRVSAKSLHAVIRVSDVEGDIEAEGSSNHVYLNGVVSRNVSATTVGGVVYFTGRFLDDGHYNFATHMGSIWLTVSEPVNARVNFSTVSGAFTTTLQHTRQEGPRRGRFAVVFGTGAATVDAQTFSGAVLVRLPEPPKKED